jgi:hypothetical protein
MSNITHDFWLWAHKIVLCFSVSLTTQGRMQDFKLGGAHLKKLRRAGGGAKISGVFRVKNHDFTPKNHISPSELVKYRRLSFCYKLLCLSSYYPLFVFSQPFLIFFVYCDKM